MGTRRNKIDREALTPTQLARLLSKSGERKVSAREIEESIDQGLPTNRDGTISIVVYGAWLTGKTRRARKVDSP